MKKVLGVICFGSLILISLGCMSQIRPFNEYVNGWVGKPIADLIAAKQRTGSYSSRTGWKDRQYKLESGNWVYVFPEREGCIVHWEVNSQDIIVSYHTEGARCDW